MQLQVSRHDQLAHDIDLVCEGVLAKPHAKHDVTCIADAKRIMKLLIEANTCAMQGVNERPMH
ncbi:hypothetical protein [Paraburkholderia sp. CI3]|uniref:hypothetical protein n=1 Tax=Paraburkholderia sp. CI3 TaxID=2991060 RepID=UPI003D20D7B9